MRVLSAHGISLEAPAEPSLFAEAEAASIR